MDATHGKGLTAEERRARRAELAMLRLPDTLTDEQRQRFVDTGDLPALFPCNGCPKQIKFRPLPQRWCADCRARQKRMNALARRLRRGAECHSLPACEQRVTSVPGGR